jgi:hypothetical protein
MSISALVFRLLGANPSHLFVRGAKGREVNPSVLSFRLLGCQPLTPFWARGKAHKISPSVLAFRLLGCQPLHTFSSEGWSGEMSPSALAFRLVEVFQPLGFSLLLPLIFLEGGSTLALRILRMERWVEILRESLPTQPLVIPDLIDIQALMMSRLVSMFASETVFRTNETWSSKRYKGLPRILLEGQSLIP